MQISTGPLFIGSSDCDYTEVGSLKRKGGVRCESTARRVKQPAYFISELAHVVAMCDERLPFVGLASEVRHIVFNIVSAVQSHFSAYKAQYIPSRFASGRKRNRFGFETYTVTTTNTRN